MNPLAENITKEIQGMLRNEPVTGKNITYNFNEDYPVPRYVCMDLATCLHSFVQCLIIFKVSQ